MGKQWRFGGCGQVKKQNTAVQLQILPGAVFLGAGALACFISGFALGAAFFAADCGITAAAKAAAARVFIV